MACTQRCTCQVGLVAFAKGISNGWDVNNRHWSLGKMICLESFTLVSLLVQTYINTKNRSIAASDTWICCDERSWNTEYNLWAYSPCFQCTSLFFSSKKWYHIASSEGMKYAQCFWLSWNELTCNLNHADVLELLSNTKCNPNLICSDILHLRNQKNNNIHIWCSHHNSAMSTLHRMFMCNNIQPSASSLEYGSRKLLSKSSAEVSML